MHVKESILVNGKELTLETGKIAKQANGAVMVRYGDSMVLVTVVASKNAREDVDFLPLTVDYIEKTYAAGRIPGNYFRREGRLSEFEILSSRLIDRPIRPLFPKGWNRETQVVATVVSHDQENPTEVLAQIGASAALHISQIPWHGPVAGVRIGRIEGTLVAYPTLQQLEQSDMDITVVASRDAIVMVEGELDQVGEDELVEALYFAHEQVQPIIDMQERLREKVGKDKLEFTEPHPDPELEEKVASVIRDRLSEALTVKEKLNRYAAIDEVFSALMDELGEEYAERRREVHEVFDGLKKKIVRGWILEEGRRLDGRGLTDVRPITCEVSVLPRVHGSALFTRGETQALVSTTLGTELNNQHMELLTGEEFRNFMLHYNFPPFSVGEVKPMRAPSRREIGHGNLAHRALSKILPSSDEFPYVIRVVSEITESNGSSSMATVCGGTLSLMDAGVPIKAPVAGIAMGLIKEGEDIAILTDILGDEDHLGDMDFKVAGTAEGITAVQMDIKIEGLPREVMRRALYQAKEARLHVLSRMLEAISSPRENLSPYAPRIFTMKIKTDKIRDIIGPGGKTIRAITEESGAQISVENDGTVTIASSDEAAAQKAIKLINSLTREPEAGVVYEGLVKRIVDFGAFVEILPGTEGLLHISELDEKRVKSVEDVIKVGDLIPVKVLSIEPNGKMRLSLKAAKDVNPDDIVKEL